MGLESLSQDELLRLRFRDLNLKWHDSDLAVYVAQLYYELELAGISFKPSILISDDWYVLEGSSTIAVPFYLAHPRLARLEREFMGRVEGSGSATIMKYLRHEAGHAIEHAYKLAEDPLRIQVFGSSERPYPRGYRPRSHTKDFVYHLGDGYAQSHPDEDFAETFAVWLDPKSQWQSRSSKGLTYKKLMAVDQLIVHAEEVQPRVEPEDLCSPLERSSKTLLAHYHAKSRRYRMGEFAGMDEWLNSIFQKSSQLKKIRGRRLKTAQKNGRIKKYLSPKNSRSSATPAHHFVESIENEVRREISRNLGVGGFELKEMLFRIKHRLRQLDLHLKSSYHQTKAEFFDFIVDLALEDIRTGRDKILL